MSAEFQRATAQHFDVLVVGAGIAGIGAGHYLRHNSPDRSFVILDAKETFGGTWVTHRYPGIRSDSDLYTFGYRFKPWTGAPIARGEEILRYIGEVIEADDLQRHIRYGHRIERASWSSADHRWTVQARRADTDEIVYFTAGFLWMCQGYYRHDEGYTPEWPGMREFGGQVVHPQTWPADLDLKGKRVLVIGSGATAATLVPSIAKECAHVTMVQRSPTYFAYGANSNELADQLRALQIDETWIHEIVRQQIMHVEGEFVRRCFAEPEAARKELLDAVEVMLGPELTRRHFTPRYLPWRQRIAFIPDADLFHAIKSGKASVATGEIERFSHEGVVLKSGETLAADVVVTATGFQMSVMGGIRFEVDGKPVDFADTVTWRGMMFTGVPNMVYVFGYTRASWTLRVDLVAEFVCRLLRHMASRGLTKVEVALQPHEAALPRLPWFDTDTFNPGFVTRYVHLWPKRLPHAHWQHTNDYLGDRKLYPTIDLDGPEFVYDRTATAGAAAAAG